MKTISLLNVYGMKNLGDAAIYQSALEMINKASTEPIKIYTHGVDIHTIEMQDNMELTNINLISPYGFVLKYKNGMSSAIGKLINFTEVMLTSLWWAVIGKVNPSLLPNDGFYFYIKSIQMSDSIVNIGGGFLRTKSKYKDFFGLLLTLLPIFIAKFYKKPMLFLPMSFGNFASDSHEYISVEAIKGSTFIARDEITLKEVGKHRRISESYSTILHCIPDLALYLENALDISNPEIKYKSSYIALTAREWMSSDKQEKYENTLAKVIDYVYEKYNYMTWFIPMAFNNVEDDDLKVANRLKDIIKDKSSLKIVNPTSPVEVQKILNSASISICTRMHSAILSATVLTPHIGIAYEHKMHGYMKLIGASEWATDIKDVNFDQIVRLVDKIFNRKEYHSYYRNLEDKLSIIKKHESKLIDVIRKFT